MAIVKSKIQNKTAAWSANIRPRVSEAVEHNGYYWSNTTGRNSEPGVGFDWVNSGAITASEAFKRWHGYRLHKESGGVLDYPEPLDEVHGRGEGQLEGGERVSLEIVNAIPDINIVTSSDYKIISSIP